MEIIDVGEDTIKHWTARFYGDVFAKARAFGSALPRSRREWQNGLRRKIKKVMHHE
jgi:hypothetical protein